MHNQTKQKNDFVMRKNSIGAEVIGTRNGEVAYQALTSNQSGFGGDQWKHQKAIGTARRVAKHLNKLSAQYDYDYALNYYK